MLKKIIKKKIGIVLKESLSAARQNIFMKGANNSGVYLRFPEGTVK